jgi:hypothetical protein
MAGLDGPLLQAAPVRRKDMARRQPSDNFRREIAIGRRFQQFVQTVEKLWKTRPGPAMS